MLSQIERRLDEKKAATKKWTGKLPDDPYKSPVKQKGVRTRGSQPLGPLVKKKPPPAPAPVPQPLPTKVAKVYDGPESSEDPKLFGVGGHVAPRVPLRPPPSDPSVPPPRKLRRPEKLPLGTKTLGAKITPEFYKELVRFRHEMKHESLAKALVAAAKRGIAGWEP